MNLSKTDMNTFDIEYVKSECFKYKMSGIFLALIFVLSLVMNSMGVWSYSRLKRIQSLEYQTMMLMTTNFITTISSVTISIISNLSCK